MKIGIHGIGGSFSDRWIAYCGEQRIPYKVVNCYATNIIQELADCTALMWHFHQGNPKDILFAKQLLYSLESGGKKAFPNFNTMWHFDDKVGQKYLLEAIDAPVVKSWVFYDKDRAIEWIEKTDFPVVFKLRNGAGSGNVRLVRNSLEAKRLAKKAFGAGFSQYSALPNLQERIRKYRDNKTTFYDVFKGIVRLVYSPQFAKVAGRERGYIYFQQFIPNNSYDIRVIVVDNKAFAIKRLVRERDFRASGSGSILYGRDNFDERTIQLSFEIAEKLKSQCIAFDYVFKENAPFVVEISYGFSPKGYDPCPGYWDREMTWHKGKFNPYGWMVDSIIRKEEIN